MVDLVVLGGDEPVAWSLGRVFFASPTAQSVQASIEQMLRVPPAGAVLLWDVTLGAPDAAPIAALLESPGDVWHAGLRLGTGGLPGVIDFIHPTWMLNRDPDPGIEATSWRLSLRASLIRTEVLRQLGGPCPTFRSLDAAGLELGHRYIRRGAFVRHVPDLVPEGAAPTPPELSVEDELRFALYRFGPKWARWALMRALATGCRPHIELLAAWRHLRKELRPSEPTPYQRPPCEAVPPADAKVTVLIPTLDRYPYLHTVLDQLRAQTFPPHEVVVVDQTPSGERDLSYRETFADLPLTVIEQDEPGQCMSRNEGIKLSTGDWILLLDDDIEIEEDLIERHLRTCERFGCEVSSGVAEEAGGGPLPPDLLHIQVSGVFPAGNTLVHRTALQRAGLFDLAYNRGQRADGDLGMRVYLSGVMMVLDPEISVFHHHAPRGGLRAHKARAVTYASSREQLTHRHLPSVSEIYLMRRYFTDRQVREALWMRAVGTLSGRGARWKRLKKAGLGLVMLPDTLRQFKARYRQATEMLREYPQIPRLVPHIEPVNENA